MSYGLYVNPQNGGKPFRLDESDCQMLTKLKHVLFKEDAGKAYPTGEWTLNKDKKAWFTPVPGIERYDAFLVVKKGTQSGEVGGLTGAWPAWIDKAWLADGGLYAWSLGSPVYHVWDDPYKEYFAFDVFGIPKRTATDNSYGIQLTGMNGVTTLSDFTKTGYCVWAGEVPAKRFTGISVPGINIGDEYRYSTYARPKSGEVILTRMSGSIRADRDTTLQVAVFDHQPNLSKMSGWGVEIYNSRGQVTYNTRYAPMLGGQVLDGNKGGYSKYARPIYNIGTYGSYIREITKDSYFLNACGLKISGNRYDVVSFGEVAMGYQGIANGGYGVINGVFNMHCLDGNRYF
ncbi:hypothetical protein ACMGC7_01785 [Morganella morganii]|uniref:hypothetical protein n=1 Tax=Morganella morganii TaxID=582 RepID=UPI003EBE69A3